MFYVLCFMYCFTSQKIYTLFIILKFDFKSISDAYFLYHFKIKVRITGFSGKKYLEGILHKLETNFMKEKSKTCSSIQNLNLIYIRQFSSTNNSNPFELEESLKFAASKISLSSFNVSLKRNVFSIFSSNISFFALYCTLTFKIL